jgi:antitoxin ChpS
MVNTFWTALAWSTPAPVRFGMSQRTPQLFWTSENDRERLMSKKSSYKLSDLAAQCDPDAPVPQDMFDWEKAAPVGLEQTVIHQWI